MPKTPKEMERIPFHSNDLAKGTENSIMKLAQIKNQEVF